MFRIQCYNTANAADQETLSGRRPQVIGGPLCVLSVRGLTCGLQQFIWKFLNGTLTFIGLLIVLLGPALLFSSLNPTLTANPISSAEVTLGMIVVRGAAIQYIYVARRAAVSDDTGTYVLFDSVHFRSLKNISDPAEFARLQAMTRVGNHASDLKVEMMPLTQVWFWAYLMALMATSHCLVAAARIAAVPVGRVGDLAACGRRPTFEVSCV